MSISMFEKLVEYVIADETEKARALFHDIICLKSRDIYEELMEAEEEEDIEDVDVDTDSDETDGDDEDFGDEDFGDEGEGDEDFEVSDEEDFGDEDADADLEDRVVSLEDQLDELMAEFENMMSDEDEEDFGDEDFDVDGGDELETDDTQAFGDELSENIDLTPVPKVSNSEESFVNKKSTNADNSGAIGAVAKPVNSGSAKAEGRAAPKVGDLPEAGTFKNVPAKDNSKLSAAPKPVTSQASGVNTVTPFPKV